MHHTFSNYSDRAALENSINTGAVLSVAILFVVLVGKHTSGPQIRVRN